MRRLQQFVIVLLLTGFSLSAAAQVPLEPASFGNYVMQALRDRAGASAQVSATEPLAISIELSGLRTTARLDSLHRHCVRERGICRDAIRRYVESFMEMIEGEPKNPLASQLRVLVKDSAYVKRLKDTFTEKGAAPPVTKPYLAELWIVLAIAGESVHWIASTSVIERLRLDEATALDLALKNTRAAMLPLSHVAKPVGELPFSFSVGVYDSSRLLMHADWAAIADSQKGELIVAVPATDMIIFGTVQSGEDVKQFKEATLRARNTAARPLSTSLYRWHAGEWDVLSDEHMVSAPERKGSSEKVP